MRSFISIVFEDIAELIVTGTNQLGFSKVWVDTEVSELWSEAVVREIMSVEKNGGQ